jgi:outer membrane beta-barrel protein
MESRIQHILLEPRSGLRSGLFRLPLLGLCLLPGAAVFAETDPGELDLEPLVIREPDRREVRVDDLDTENFEIGIFGGVMNVEDFGSNATAGVRFAYHVTEDFFVEGTYGRTKLGETSYERLSGGAQLLTDEERETDYYSVSMGWNLLPGEAFVGSRWAFRGSLYALAGVGSTTFGGDDVFTWNVGVGYRLVATDWLAFHVDVRDLVWESDLLGSRETMHNVEFTGGVTFFF